MELLKIVNNDIAEGLNPVQQQNMTQCPMAEIEQFDALTKDRRKTLDILAMGRGAGGAYEYIKAMYLCNGDTPAFRRAILDGVALDEYKASLE